MDQSPPPAKTSRKRKRRGESVSEDSDDPSKKRGRPRTEKPDESAADRRRTQIRMAQRAYRQRKETTLDDLRKRVSDLTSTIECMNKAFEDCRDRLVSAGLPEGQLDELAEMAVRCAGFMKTVRRPSDGQEEDLVPPVTNSSTTINAASQHSAELPLVAKNVPSWIDPAAVGQTGRRPQKPEVGMGYTMVMPNAFDQLVENFSVPSMAQALQQPQTTQTQDLPSMNTFDQTAPVLLNQPSLTLASELPPPKTYSFQEKTLARRLHRACLESAYLLLLDPTRRPHTFERVFKLSLLSRDRVRMAHSIKRILNRGPEEPLELWDAPLVHIGGAGTHYPERTRNVGHPDNQNNTSKPKFHLGMIGPQMLNLLENVIQARPAAEISVEIEGYEGDWFDPYDIEGYLESKGIHIDPTVSYVEAEISDVEHAASSSTESTSSSSGRTSSSNKLPASIYSWDPEKWSELQGLDAGMERWQEVENLQVSGLGLGLGNVGYSDADTGSWMNLMDGYQEQQNHQNHAQQKGAAVSNDAIFDNNVEGTAANSGAFSIDAGIFPNHGFYEMPPQVTTPSPLPRQARKVVIIDVAKFVKVLTVTGVCLGRVPGFKRKDVDRALAISSFEAF